MSKVKYLDYKGDKLPYRVSYKSISKWQEETGKSLSDLEEIDSQLSLIEPLFYWAVVVGCKYDGIELKYKRDELEDVLDDNWMEFMSGIGDFFLKGAATKAPQSKKK